MRIGEFELHLISDGTLALDGGAMFGVVPRVVWEKRVTPDALNRIRLGMNCLLIQSPSETILVDTGCGSKFSSKELEMYGIQQDGSLLDGLRQLEKSPRDITLVINTHLHFDHCGGNTRYQDGSLVPTFPRAQYVVQGREFTDAQTPNERNRASYLSENWSVLQESDQLRLIDGEVEVLPGVILVPTPGHTLGHQSVRIHNGDRTLFFLGDLCPTSAHVPLAWVMGYDLYPLTTLETRRSVYRCALEEGWELIFEHDAEKPYGRLVMSGGKYGFQPLEWR